METPLSATSRRLQFSLTERQYRFLLSESSRTGLPMAELIRRAIDSEYRPGLQPLWRGYEFTLGLFKRPDPAVVGRRGRNRLSEP